jgi:hypothetical protein
VTKRNDKALKLTAAEVKAWREAIRRMAEAYFGKPRSPPTPREESP